MKKALNNSNLSLFLKIIKNNDNFFNDIRNYMVDVEWTYFYSEYSPSIRDLKDTVEYLMKQTIKSSACNYGTGGFMVYNDKHKLIITFKEKENHNFEKFRLEVDINELRNKKLNRII